MVESHRTNDSESRDVQHDASIAFAHWIYGLKESRPVCLSLRFGEDGRIHNYYSENEVSWSWQESDLVIYDAASSPRVRFRNVRGTPIEGGTAFEGHYGENPHSVIRMVCQPMDYEPAVFCHLRDTMGDLVRNHGYEVGDYSYGFVNAIDPQFGKMKIGKYCAIGPNFSAIIGNHDYRMVSNYPFQVIDRHFGFVEQQWNLHGVQGSDHYSNGITEIGNDVWIGKDVTVISGIRIGDGAVIAAGAVVTKEVAPYAIVGGNPAKFIKYRFSAQTIERLLRLKWWDFPRSRVETLLPKMVSHDIELFLFEAESYINR